MIPASEVDWLDAEVTADAALTLTVAHRRSRYPVANGSLDRLIGVVHIQDIIEAARTEPDAPLEELAQAPLIVPETNDLGALLRDDDLNETVGTRLPQAAHGPSPDLCSARSDGGRERATR